MWALNILFVYGRNKKFKPDISVVIVRLMVVHHKPTMADKPMFELAAFVVAMRLGIAVYSVQIVVVESLQL